MEVPNKKFSLKNLHSRLHFSEICLHFSSSFLILNCISKIFSFWIDSFRVGYRKIQCGEQHGGNNKSTNDFVHVLVIFFVLKKMVFKLAVNLDIWKILTFSS